MPGGARKELDNDDVSFGYWNEAGLYIAASTFMPVPFCNASGNGKTYMIYK